MIETNSISISKSVESVFDMVTDPTRAHEWTEFARSVEILSRGEWGGYNQARWISIKGKVEIETIETVLKYERPTLLASKAQITRTTRIYGKPPKNGLPPVGEIEHPDEIIVEQSFDNDEMSVLSQLDFTPTGKNSMTLRITTDCHLGWVPLIMMWVGKVFRIRPHKKLLEAIKKAAENTLEDSIE